MENFIVNEVVSRDLTSIERLFYIWNGAVRATHHFLSEEDIRILCPCVKNGLKNVDRLFVAKNGEQETVGFVGVEGDKIEMLFVAPEYFGRGVGKLLTAHVVEGLGGMFVDVNEQNPGAFGFYQSIGFEVAGRSETDGQGNPFPILHMRLRG